MKNDVLDQPVAVASEPVESDPRIAFAVKLGRALHQYGTPTHRLERAMNLILRKLGLDGHFFSTPTGIFASFGLPEEHRTSLIRVEPSEVNLEKLTLLDDLVGRVAHGEINAATAAKRVDEIVAAPPRYGPWLSAFSFGVVSGAAARFFGGGWRECVAAMFIGLVLGGFAAIVGRSEDASRIFEPMAAVIAAALAMIAARMLSPVSVYITTLAGLIVLVPGFTLTVAMRELSTGNLIAGTARLMGAALLFLEIGFGVALGSQINRLLPEAVLFSNSVPLAPWTLWIALLIAPLAFAVLLHARPQDIGWIMLAGCLSFGGARAGAIVVGPQLGACLGAIVVGAGSNLYARVMNRPAAVPLVPGIMLLVPGSVGFGSFAKFIERDIITGVETAFNMILIAVALVTGLLIANIIVAPRKAL